MSRRESDSEEIRGKGEVTRSRSFLGSALASSASSPPPPSPRLVNLLHHRRRKRGEERRGEALGFSFDGGVGVRWKGVEREWCTSSKH